MFLWTFDLRTLLFIALLLPLAGTLLALLVVRWQRQRRQAADLAARLDLLLNQAPVGLLLFDQADALLQANPVARRLLHLSPSTADLPIALPDQRWARLLQSDLHESGRYRTVELTPVAPAQDGGLNGGLNDDEMEARMVRWWITRQERIALVLLFDITDQQVAEGAANRLLSDLSHELRTPLATLLTHLEVLSLPALSDEVRGQSIQFMKDETQRLVRMSNRTLELGQLQSSAAFEPRGVRLRPLVESVVSQMQVEAAAQDGRIVLEADEALPLVSGEPDQLRQVLLNLIDNAVKYGGSGNLTTVSLRRVENGVACTIRDRGPGIAGDHVPNLTRRFYRAAPSDVSGSGLGLSMVREILRRHNSQLQVTSQTEGDERGTTVRFALPLYPGARDAPGAKSSEGER